jgi:hypothetical protein
MALRIDLSPVALEQAITMLRTPKSISEVSRHFHVSDFCLRSNLKRAGVLEEFTGRKGMGFSTGVPVSKLWDEDASKKHANLKLRVSQ